MNADRPNGNYEHDVAFFVSQYAKWMTWELQDALKTRGRMAPSPWQRLAIRRVLKARGEKE